MEKFADSVIRLRWPIFIAMLVITAFFAWEATYVRFQTAISNLWPVANPIIKVYKQYEGTYGSPLTVYVMVRVKHGTIYDPTTLDKIRRITNDLDGIAGVNHNHVVSITSRKVKRITLIGGTVTIANLFPVQTPRTSEELSQLREAVAAAGVAGTLVSFDGTASLISAEYIESSTDFNRLFDQLLEIRKQEADSNHEIFIAGQPVLAGWIHSYQGEDFRNFIISMALIVLVLYIYIRSWRLTSLPVLATAVSTIWGLGFAGLLRFTLDPLIILIPVLIMARTFSHGIQKIERIIELSDKIADQHSKAKALILALFGSGTLGIVADVIGLLVISVSSIPVMRQLSIFCAFWAVSIIPTVLILVPVVLAIFGIPESWTVKHRLETSSIRKLLKANAWMVTGSRARWVTACFVIITVVSLVISTQIGIGDVHPGTSLLWPDAQYNVAVANINKSFAGMDEFDVIAQARPGGSEVESLLGVRQVAALEEMRKFERYVGESPVVRGVFSYADFFSVFNRRMHGNYVKWDFLPKDQVAVAQYSNLLVRGTDPGDFNRFVDERYRSANVIISLADHRGETLRRIVSWIEKYKEGADHHGAIDLKLAIGSAGVLAAVNQEVEQKELIMFVGAVAIVGIACLITFQSMFAAIVLMIPLIVTNFVVTSVMVYLQIGLDVNTLPIVSVGMGVGIDYGIYLLTRILQEYQRSATKNYDEAITIALETTGRAVFFTATVMTLCVGIWYFLSSFRFMADMGYLLALVMFINMLGAMLVVPALVSVLKPRFASAARLLVWD